MNSRSPAAALKFYTAKFDCREAVFDSRLPAVLAQRTWLLFDAVNAIPEHEITSAIWHIGWGAEDMPAEYTRQISLGTAFETPITDISDLVGRKPGSFYFAYVVGPDRELIELNTAAHHSFGHLHLLSADPVAAAEWYRAVLGVQVLSVFPQSREYRGFPVGPSASLRSGDVSIIIYPMDYARKAWPALWRDRTSFSSTKGRVIDHVAFSVDNLDAAVSHLKGAGIALEGSPASIPGTRTRSVFLAGPDQIRIELVEAPTAQ